MQTPQQLSGQPNISSACKKALRIKQVLERTGLSRTHTYRLIAREDHPKAIQLSERVFEVD